MKYKYTDKELILTAQNFQTKGELKKKDPNTYQTINKRGLQEKAFAHMPKRAKMQTYGANNPNYKYTDEELTIEGLKYKFKGDFAKANRKMYDIAYHRGLFATTLSHFPETASRGKVSPVRIWTKENLPSHFLQFTTKKEAAQKSSSAVDAARNLGIYNEVTAHMKSGYVETKPEKELVSILKEKFPQADKKKYSVNISSKPWIHRFELDICNPLNSKAIEYDGEYHHSEKALIKNKTQRGWPEEDAGHYHEIKDSYFLNYHNITVLHIKGEDWKRNKDYCIKLSIAFISGNCSIYPKPLILPI